MARVRTVIVVLGCAVTADGQPSPALERRLRRALQEHRRRPGSRLVVTGGTQGSLPAEADVMAAWLVEKRVAPEAIVREPRAHNTLQNVQNTLALLDGDVEILVVVTERFHMRRASALFGRALAAGGGPHPRLERASAPDAHAGATRALLWAAERCATWRDAWRLR